MHRIDKICGVMFMYVHGVAQIMTINVIWISLDNYERWIDLLGLLKFSESVTKAFLFNLFPARKRAKEKENLTRETDSCVFWRTDLSL